MIFKKFWDSLAVNQKEKFASDCGLSIRYIETQIYYAYKTPRPKTLQKMVDNSNGLLSIQGLHDFFLKKTKEVTQ